MRVSRGMFGAAVVVMLVTVAQAGTVGFTANATGNSSDFAAFVSSKGAAITTLDFEAHPTGALQTSFYSGLGVTLTPSGNVDTVLSGSGPDDGNTQTGPLSSGEGAHAPSNYLLDQSGNSTLTISFDAPVYAAGLFTIDHYNPSNNDGLIIEAFSGVNGTGASLGSFNSLALNFQPDNLYFMGVGRDEGDIRSVVFRDPLGTTGDNIGLDDIQFALAGSTVVPLPSAAFLGLGLLGGLGLLRRLRKRRSA